MKTFTTFVALAIAGASLAYGNPTTTTTTIYTSTKTECHSKPCVPTVTVIEHLKPKDGCNVKCSTEWAGNFAVWVHDGRPSRDQDQDHLPNVAMLVLHHGFPVYDYCRVSEDDIQIQVSEMPSSRC
ncbi:hypothetical protein TOPH_03786 [Tolypocladium ophioglossoides CBS 100239]|uniref:Secreted protein n=1 Tax=Tolypocladium ophioglossoides (strain CBS 100239) TaxID=1163406 RepID=A0A0L0NCY0_TOLOC|nr:hypothetical protein TOPH_03786 [Tolypocladium ophioglossoides CBS 100239]